MCRVYETDQCTELCPRADVWTAHFEKRSQARWTNPSYCRAAEQSLLFCKKVRWSRPFFHLKITLTQIKGLDSFLSTFLQQRTIDRELHHLEKFVSILGNFQEKGLVLNKVCFVFDSIIAGYPSMRLYLVTDAAIAQNHQFESKNIKLLNGKEGNIIDFKRGPATTCWLVTTSHHVKDAQEPGKVSHVPCYKQIKAKLHRRNTFAEFLVRDFLPTTSCSADRVFSMVRWVLSDVWKRISPTILR